MVKVRGLDVDPFAPAGRRVDGEVECEHIIRIRVGGRFVVDDSQRSDDATFLVQIHIRAAIDDAVYVQLKWQNLHRRPVRSS